MPSRHSSLVQVQLGRVLKYGGAVRLSQVVESISHVVHSVSTTTVLPHTTKLLASLPDLSPHQVSVQWLAESFRLGRPAPESDFTFPAVKDREDPAQSGESGDSLPPLLPPDSQVEAGTGGEETTHFEQRLLAQYGSTPGNLTRTRTEDVSQILPFLAGKKINIAGFDEETAQVRLRR